MKILVTGSSGLIGSALMTFLEEQGHQITRLVHKKDPKSGGKEKTLEWKTITTPGKETLLEGFDAVVNLAGENIASGRWTRAKKKKIEESRIETTRKLCEMLAKQKKPPKVIVSASAVGYYGDQGDKILTETAPQGEGFLADVCQKWEQATKSAVERGIRVVNPRIAMVLTPSGGALQKMLPAFKLGLGGVLGSGKQYMSWIALEDLIQLIDHCLKDETLSGPVNASSPHPVTNEVFTRTLASSLKRPSFLPVPAWLLKCVLGQMATELFLSSTRAYPEKALKHGFAFKHPTLEEVFS